MRLSACAATPTRTAAAPSPLTWSALSRPALTHEMAGKHSRGGPALPAPANVEGRAQHQPDHAVRRCKAAMSAGMLRAASACKQRHRHLHFILTPHKDVWHALQRAGITYRTGHQVQKHNSMLLAAKRGHTPSQSFKDGLPLSYCFWPFALSLWGTLKMFEGEQTCIPQPGRGGQKGLHRHALVWQAASCRHLAKATKK
jgi:hypothetical protein